MPAARAGSPASALAIGLGVAAAAIAVAITIGLFRVLGARRTRLVAQVFAAVIGAGFAIGIQVFAIVYYGTMVAAGDGHRPDA